MPRWCRMLWVAVVALGWVHAATAAPEHPKITIALTGSSTSVTTFYAKDHGLFAKHGLEGTVRIVTDGSAAVAGLVSGDFQFAVPTGTVFVQAVDGGLDLVAAASAYVFPSPTSVGVLARPASGIRAAGDLVGKRIGVPGRGGLQDALTHEWLSRNKVDPAGVSFVEVAFSKMTDMLRADQVDAVTANDPVYNRIVDGKLAVPIFDLSRLIPDGTAGAVYATTREWADRNPQTLAAFRAVLVDAIEGIARDPAAAKASIAHFTNLPADVMATTQIPSLSASLDPKQLAFWIDLLRGQGEISRAMQADRLMAAD